MKKKGKSPLKFRLIYTRIRRLDFESILPPSGEPVNFTMSITLGFNYLRKQKRLSALISIGLSGKEAPFRIDLEYEGMFALNRQATKKEVEPFAKVNCNGILFPFVRETIAEITRRAGYAPFHLESMNFIEMARESEKKPSGKKPTVA